ncbi:MAG: hypothetical protein AUG51_16135 [Acidobacteria bacterium 13_1_20CM_3_53_8]|nr:MAG: hypothetical protein AUG51_16135 [Acidobacteria bacterium 13_1_20CM_3_53_8]
MTLEEFRLECGWSKIEMCRQARVDFKVLQKAEAGEEITVNTANKFARALSKELGRAIHYQDIEGLKIK